ncbi:MAG: hypothetical protein ACE10E_03460 [Acidiferrobacterales bacterium]|nr:hypothetical protein [Gammaproteobacteria bacterium]
MLKKLLYVSLFGSAVAVSGVAALQYRLAMGPLLIALGVLVLFGLGLVRRPLRGAIPDLVFGSIDTGLLTIPALWGGALFGVPGAIAGGVIGDALTDAIAGFFEGSVAQWLQKKGFESRREPVTTALGKMAGCLLGAGLVLCVALLFGISPAFD